MPTSHPQDVLALCERLNPAREPGRLVLFTRMGADRIADALPPLLRAVTMARHPVVWACDPMHANTFSHASGYKTRRFTTSCASSTASSPRAHTADVAPGGVHIELTGEDVTECLGGDSDEVLENQLEQRYETMCDPRLNARQSLDLAFRVAEPAAALPAPRERVRPLRAVLLGLTVEVFAPRPCRHPDQHRDRADERDARADEQAGVERVDERRLRPTTTRSAPVWPPGLGGNRERVADAFLGGVERLGRDRLRRASCRRGARRRSR